MKVSYQREMKRNYMIIDPEDLLWDGYECRMMLRNNIDGLLSLRVRPVEDGVRFYYDITSKQPLSRMLHGAQWKAEEFRSLIIQINEILTRMDNFLLKESGIYLDPDFIYMEPESHRISLCLVPGMERPFSDDFGNLSERLLECVDHRDKECVVLAYGVYQETRKENYGLEDIMKRIYQRPDFSTVQPLTVAKEEENLLTFSDDLSKEEEKAEKAAQGGPKSDEPTFWEKLKERVFHRITEKEEEEVNFSDWFENPDEPSDISRQLREDIVYNLPDKEEASMGNTMILSDLADKISMRRLHALNQGVPDIPIAYYPFIIGKQENLVDYRLNDDTVSRLHLKIDRKDNRYLIQDLNSTNGTTLRGNLLTNNALEEIMPGDEIGIARYLFRFE